MSVFGDYAVDSSYHPVGHKLLDLRLVLEPFRELLGVVVVEALEPLGSNEFLPEVERLPLIWNTLTSNVAADTGSECADRPGDTLKNRKRRSGLRSGKILLSVLKSEA